MLIRKSKYAAGMFLAVFLVLFFMTMRPVKVYASQKKVTVRFYSAAGTEYRQYRKTVKKGKKISLPEVPEHSFVCYGWSTKKNGKGKVYKSWTRRGFSKNTKLYAMVWAENRDRTKNQEKIWRAAMRMNETIVTMNNTYPGTWRYANNNVAGSFQSALKTGRYWTDCSRGVSWLIKEAGLSRKKHYKCINIGGSYTVGQLLYGGHLTCGDQIDYYGFSHTNMYLGQNVWFDTGRYNCAGSEIGAPFRRFVCYQGMLSRRVSRIWRLKK